MSSGTIDRGKKAEKTSKSNSNRNEVPQTKKSTKNFYCNSFDWNRGTKFFCL